MKKFFAWCILLLFVVAMVTMILFLAGIKGTLIILGSTLGVITVAGALVWSIKQLLE